MGRTNRLGTRSVLFSQFTRTYLNNSIVVKVFNNINPRLLYSFDSYENSLSYFIRYYTKLYETYGLAVSAQQSTLKKTSCDYNNLLVFSKPKRQLFTTLFIGKPVFIFTGGLMRMIINEKKKSSKRAHKVATSLIKLASIVMSKQQNLLNCTLKLKNIGSLRSKVVKTFSKAKLRTKLSYIIIVTNFDMSAQKLNTRRSIKKYVKKRLRTM